MKLIYRKTLWALLGVVIYASIITIGVVIFVNVNIATFFWGNVFPYIIIIIGSCLGGGWFWIKAFTLQDPPPYDLEFLKHEVINQLETDFEEQNFEALDKLLTDLTETQHELLFEFLSETGQKNLIEGLTHLRY